MAMLQGEEWELVRVGKGVAHAGGSDGMSVPQEEATRDDGVDDFAGGGIFEEDIAE